MISYRTALVQLPLVCEVQNQQARTPKDVARICTDITDLAQETMQVLLLNTRHALIDRIMVSLGSVNATCLHAREIFRPAIQQGATMVVLVHNHPSGDTSPSSEDVKATGELIQAGKIIGIPVLDHVIVGQEGRYTSLREAGLVEFAA